MIHRGEIFQKAVLKSQLSITRVAKLLGVSTRQIYKLYEKEKISNETLVQYGKILGYDFSRDIPELVEFIILKEPQEVYITNAQYREKYFALMEEHLQTIKKLEEAMKKVNTKVTAAVKKAPAKKKK
jgi:predicted transcriptional regulator